MMLLTYPSLQIELHICVLLLSLESILGNACIEKNTGAENHFSLTVSGRSSVIRTAGSKFSAVVEFTQE